MAVSVSLRSAQLSSGNSYKDCGHPCTRHSLHLVDENQHRHHVLADSGCRNTVFNAQPQSAAPYVAQLLAAGVANLRVELTDQPAELVGPLLTSYAALARGERAPDALLAWLDENLVDSTGARCGVTTGSFKPSAERAWASLRPTRYEAKAREGAACAEGRPPAAGPQQQQQQQPGKGQQQRWRRAGRGAAAGKAGRRGG